MAPKLKLRWSKMVKDVDLKDLTDAHHFRQVLEQIKKGKDQFILKDNGQPQAALLSLDDLELLKKMKANKKKAWKDLFENLKKVHALNSEFSAEEVDADVDEAIKAIRRGQN